MSFLFFLFFFYLLVKLGLFLTSFLNFMGQREMSSPFECGFEVKNNSRSPFSLRFFLMLMLFLMFDVEMILVLQFPFFLSVFKMMKYLGILLFIILLFVATIEEWRRGFLSWM